MCGSTIPNFEYWRQFQTLEVFEIASLMSGVDPRRFCDATDEHGDVLDLSDEIRKLTGAATVKNITAYPAEGGLINKHTQIKRESLVQWLREHDYPVLADELDNKSSDQSEQEQPEPDIPSKHQYDRQTLGIPTKEIVEKFRLEDVWASRLSHGPKDHPYLAKPVLVQQGGRGKGSNLWNPAQFGQMLVIRHDSQKEDGKNLTSVRFIIEKYFAEWLDEFDELSGWNYV